MTSPKYDIDYFENGVEKHISGYTNYRWRPEYVLPLANWLKQKFPNKTFLDYGCAKGFLVKALRLLNCQAKGFDISEYAINNCEPEVRDYVSYKSYNNADVVVCKDVLEHLYDSQIQHLLRAEFGYNQMANQYVVVIVPLGDDNKFRIREYELDVTHVTKKDEVWWIKEFNTAGFVLDEFYYKIDGIKDNWTSQYPYGNGIFIFKRKE